MSKKQKVIDQSVPLSITDFCTVEGISEFTYFMTLRPRGLTPREDRIPGTKIVRISPQSRVEWRERLQSIAAQEQIARERERRVELCIKAGKIGAASPLHVSNRRKTAIAPPKRPRGRPKKLPQAAE
jgi:hypothetical protein